MHCVIQKKSNLQTFCKHTHKKKNMKVGVLPQDGGWLLHDPSVLHTNSWVPFILYPTSHVYKAWVRVPFTDDRVMLPPDRWLRSLHNSVRRLSTYSLSSLSLFTISSSYLFNRGQVLYITNVCSKFRAFGFSNFLYIQDLLETIACYPHKTIPPLTKSTHWY